MKQNDLITLLFTVLKESVDTVTLPTGKNLLPSLKYSCIILLASSLSKIFGLFTFISWQGALLGVVCLLCLCYIERSEDNEVSRLYRDVKLRANDIKRRATRSSTDKQDDGVTDACDENVRENSTREEPCLQDDTQ